MPRTPATQPPAEAPVPSAHNVAGIGRRAWEQFAENPLHTLFSTAIVALLVFNLTSTNARIDDTNAGIDDTNARITRLEAKVDALAEDVAEINLKLTALIAALNKTEEVDAALEGRLIGRAPTSDPAAEPG